MALVPATQNRPRSVLFLWQVPTIPFPRSLYSARDSNDTYELLLTPQTTDQVHEMFLLHEAENPQEAGGDERASEKAFKCFVRSVHALQNLDLQGETLPQAFADTTSEGEGEGGIVVESDKHVLEDEQAGVFSCWAESVLLKFRCVGGLAAVGLNV